MCVTKPGLCKPKAPLYRLKKDERKREPVAVYDLGLGGDFRTSEAAVSEGELISKIRARLTTRLSLLFTRGATDQHGSQMRERVRCSLKNLTT